MKEIVIASSNKSKIKEIESIFSGYKFISKNDAGFKEDIEETGDTFLENAIIKAKTVSEKLNLITLSDDSGLVVDALNGAPGVYSARFSGEDATDMKNNLKLLKLMENEKNRKAKFVSVVVLYYPNGEYLTGVGETYGEILNDFEGENGFGYDSLFFSYELQKSFGIAKDTEKNSISHRYKALIDLKSKLTGDNK